MTKQAYRTHHARLTDTIAAIQTRLDAMDRDYAGASITMEASQTWNRLHDKVYSLNKELEALEDAWSRRHWTFQDWTQWRLITDNRD